VWCMPSEMANGLRVTSTLSNQEALQGRHRPRDGIDCRAAVRGGGVSGCWPTVGLMIRRLGLVCTGALHKHRGSAQRCHAAAAHRGLSQPAVGLHSHCGRRCVFTPSCMLVPHPFTVLECNTRLRNMCFQHKLDTMDQLATTMIMATIAFKTAMVYSTLYN
jgi:hypothetical protein